MYIVYEWSLINTAKEIATYKFILFKRLPGNLTNAGLEALSFFSKIDDINDPLSY